MLVLNAANRDFSEIIPGTARLYAIANAAEGELSLYDFFFSFCGKVKLQWFPDQNIAFLRKVDLFCVIRNLCMLFFFLPSTSACPEVNRLETSRAVIFEAVRCSFASAYDALVLDPSDRVSGAMYRSYILCYCAPFRAFSPCFVVRCRVLPLLYNWFV